MSKYLSAQVAHLFDPNTGRFVGHEDVYGREVVGPAYGVDAFGNVNGLLGSDGMVNVNAPAPTNPLLSQSQANQIYPSLAPNLFTVTGAIPNQYNPADPQCVFARLLTGAPQNTPAQFEVGNATITNPSGVLTYDGALGLVCDGTAGTQLLINLTGIAALATSTTYMVYLEVERSLLAVPPSQSDYSAGIPLSNPNNAIIGLWQQNAAPQNNAPIQFGVSWASPNKSLACAYVQANNTSNTFGGYYTDIDAPVNDTHVPVVFCVDNGYTAIFVNGNVIGMRASSTNLANIALQYISIGKNWGSDGNNSFKDGHIRKIMVINGRGCLSTSAAGPLPLLNTNGSNGISIFGDSFADPIINYTATGAGGYNQPTNWYYANSSTMIQIGTYLRRYGYHAPNCNDLNPLVNASSSWGQQGYRMCGWYTAKGSTPIAQNGAAAAIAPAPGAPINAAACDTVAGSSSVGYLWDYLPSVLASNPAYVVLSAGTNDSSSQNSSGYARWYRYFLEYLFGLNGNAPTSVKGVVLVTNIVTPYDYNVAAPTRLLAAEAQNAAIAATVAWFQQTYPASAKAVAIADWYSAVGGHVTYSQAFGLPQTSSGSGNIHPGPIGKMMQGQVIAQALLNLQSQLSGAANLPSSFTPLPQKFAYQSAPPLQKRLLGSLRGQSMAATGDFPIFLNWPGTLPSNLQFRIDEIVLVNYGSAISTAAGGVYTATAAGGTAILNASPVTFSLGAGTLAAPTLSAPALAAGISTTIFNSQMTVVGQDQFQLSAPLYFHVGTAQAGTLMDILVYGTPISPL